MPPWNNYSSVKLSPCARGWTDPGHRTAQPECVVPVRTGVDRRRVPDGARRLCCPRAHGGGPVRTETRRQGGIVVPVRTGVDRGRRRCGVGCEALSPCARGWTALVEGWTRNCGVVPVRTGVDRSPERRECRICCCPRAHGGGPSRTWSKARARELSPCARGWTVQRGG